MKKRQKKTLANGLSEFMTYTADRIFYFHDLVRLGTVAFYIDEVHQLQAHHFCYMEPRTNEVKFDWIFRVMF